MFSERPTSDQSQRSKQIRIQPRLVVRRQSTGANALLMPFARSEGGVDDDVCDCVERPHHPDERCNQGKRFASTKATAPVQTHPASCTKVPCAATDACPACKDLNPLFKRIHRFVLATERSCSPGRAKDIAFQKARDRDSGATFVIRQF